MEEYTERKDPTRPIEIQDTPQQAKKKRKGQIKEKIQEQFTGETGKRRVTRSQLAKENGKTVIVNEISASKGSLNDLLHTIYIEETSLVQAELLEANKNKTKGVKSSKKLQFDDQISEFVFKPRRPVIRHLKGLQEVEPEVSEID